jgi:hypothetical protein
MQAVTDRNEEKLWLEVLLLGLRDSMVETPKISPDMSGDAVHKIRVKRLEKKEAIRWIKDNGRDFRTVCWLAGYDPDYVRERWQAGFNKGEILL